MAITLEDLRDLLARRRDALLAAVRDVLLQSEPDPFAVSYDEYLAMSEDAQVVLARRAHALREDFLESEFEHRCAEWLVVAGDDVAASGPDAQDCPEDDALAAIGKSTGKVPFLFTRLLVEEATARTRWARLPRGDSYPTIAAYFSAPGSGDEIFDRCPIVADLDTGSPAVFVGWPQAGSAGWIPTSRIWRKDRHLGQDYEWRPVRVSVGVVDARGGRHRAEMTVAAVRNWSGGPFVRVNRARNALAGRNLLFALHLRVLLLADVRETEIPPE